MALADKRLAACYCLTADCTIYIVQFLTRAMKQFAAFTTQAREAIEKGDFSALADLMDANFEYVDDF